MKIAILGTKGVPNNYGGYEQFAEYISQRLVKRGHVVTVYNPSFHGYQKPEFNGVSIITKFSPEKWMGGAANFVYDFLCLRDALKRDFDIIYEAGYHSVALSYWLLGVRKRKGAVLVTNMDGLEYNRSKWNSITKWLIRKLEQIAIRESPYLISDNIGIQKYYRDNFGKGSYFLPYGADPVSAFDETHLTPYAIQPRSYLMLVARLEPENSIETILDGYMTSQSQLPFLVVGNHKTGYGMHLQEKYRDERIRFIGGIYQKPVLDSIRHFSAAYFHGHSVGGTNPSLLEAMACECFIIGHDNPFNRNVLYEAALYFKDSAQVTQLLNQLAQLREKHEAEFIAAHRERIRTEYNWDRVVIQHEDLFRELLAKQ